MESLQSPKLDNFGRDYLRLTLEIHKHIDGYIDAYIGPPELKAEVEAGQKKAPAALLDDLARLQEMVPAGDPAHHAFLVATLRAIECTLRLLNGEQFEYLDEVNRLFDIRPELVDETHFTQAHQELDTLLPGDTPLPERIEARRQQYEVATGRLLSLLEMARDETRRRTAAFFDLPAGEAVEVRLTNHQPWSAYNWYLGHGRSLIEVNTDVPVSALSIADLFAHEGYPGHHTEHILKEKMLYWGKGYAEEASLLLHSPAAVINEAVATTAIEIIFPDKSHYDWTNEALLPVAGLHGEPAGYLRRLSQAQRSLRYVSGNAAILYHTGRLAKEQTVEYIQTYALTTPARAEKSFSFISHPLFRAYTFTYTWGYDLLEQAADGDKTPLFRRLLTEQLLPSQLAEGITG
ncbi:MAG: hypothetical protein L0346_27420 [Chloroflexi bacterium]|nr:hypothetical protein [Chloroflexota bacterium]